MLECFHRRAAADGQAARRPWNYTAPLTCRLRVSHPSAGPGLPAVRTADQKCHRRQSRCTALPSHQALRATAGHAEADLVMVVAVGGMAVAVGGKVDIELEAHRSRNSQS